MDVRILFALFLISLAIAWVITYPWKWRGKPVPPKLPVFPIRPIINTTDMPMLPERTFYISDNMGGFDGYLVDHVRGEKLNQIGWYRVRELGSIKIYWKFFDYIPSE